MRQADSLRHIANVMDTMFEQLDANYTLIQRLEAQVGDYKKRLETEMTEVKRLQYELDLRKGF
jgi:regulator of replication initiation timing